MSPASGSTLTARDALVDGIRRVNKAPMILACVFVVTLLVALPLSAVLGQALRASFGNSLAADQAAEGVNYQWWAEFAAQSTGFTRTFTTSVIGFAAVLDNLSTLVDRGGRPAGLLWLGAAYLLLWLFLSGGILDRFARSRPARSYEFFTACGVCFVRFLRLAPIIALVYFLLFRYVHVWLFVDVYNHVTRDLAVERTALMWRAGLYAVFGSLLMAVNVVFDYAKVRAVVEDRHSMIGAVVAGLRFVTRNIGAVAALYVMNGLLFVGAIALYALVSPGALPAGLLMWIGFAAGQAYLLARLWVKLVFFASEVSLFQDRLAHPGYVASPAVRLPEPPIVEQVLSLEP